MDDNGKKSTVSVKEKSPEMTYGRKKIFIKNIWGTYQKRRWMVFSFFLTLFFFLPFLRIDDRPAILFDIPARKFHIFYVTLWPQEIFLLTLALITMAIGLFFSTTLLGRVWCGYMCPQTVFTSIFVEIERMILGDSIKQIKFSKQPWSGIKVSKLMFRNILWGLVAFAAGFTFLSYFIPNTEIVREIFTGELSGWAVFWLLFITGAAFFDFGFFREQTCFIPCPYGRFQGVLQDSNSLVVTYDKARGETTSEKKGDCINCNFCVIVCPTGIDIRNGAQSECIECARCVDACNIVMTKQKKPTGLIRYASENSLKGLPTKVIRPRVLIYSVILLSLISFMGLYLFTRPGFDLEVTRYRGMVYQPLPNNRTGNTYSLKILNMSNQDAQYYIGLNKFSAELIAGENPVVVKAGEIHDTTVTLIVDNSQHSSKVNNFQFTLSRGNGKDRKIVEEKTTFIMP